MREIYSYRNRNKELDQDIYEYETVSDKFRNQFLCIIYDLFDYTNDDNDYIDLEIFFMTKYVIFSTSIPKQTTT